MRRPRLLDLYCGQGAASVGYYLAGFDVIGADTLIHPGYPFAFIGRDPLSVVQDTALMAEFDAVHALPWLLEFLGPIPWVVESVATLPGAVMLCGTHFSSGTPGCHRYYQASFALPGSGSCSCPSQRPRRGRCVAPDYTRWIGEQLMHHLGDIAYARDDIARRIGGFALT